MADEKRCPILSGLFHQRKQYAVKMPGPSLIYLLKVFLFLGSTAFGGYTALVSMIKKKLVDEDQMLDEQVIFDGITIASILPGPLAVNVVTYIGYHLRGWAGAIVSLIAIVLPSFVLVTGLAWLYYSVEYVPEVSSFLQGVYPVIAAIILGVAWNFFKKHLTSTWQYLLFGAILVSMFFVSGYWMLVACLLVGAGVGMRLGHVSAENGVQDSSQQVPRAVWRGLVVIIGIVAVLISLLGSANAQLFSAFARISLTLFGGGYAMIPMIELLVVEQYGWLSSEEFYNAIAFGQVTPGPILISAAYVGFAHMGLLGAAIATVAIFLPAALLMVVVGAWYKSISHLSLVNRAILGIRPVVIALILYSVLLVLKATPLDLFTFASLIGAFTLITIFKVSFWIPMLGSGLIKVLLANL